MTVEEVAPTGNRVDSKIRVFFGLFMAIILLALTIYSLTVPSLYAVVFYAVFAYAFIITLYEAAQL